MSLKGQVDRLEKNTDANHRACHCSRADRRTGARVVVYFPDDGEAEPPAVCEDCGGQVIRLRVVYEKPELLSYQPQNEPPLKLRDLFERFRKSAREV